MLLKIFIQTVLLDKIQNPNMFDIWFLETPENQANWKFLVKTLSSLVKPNSLIWVLGKLTSFEYEVLRSDYVSVDIVGEPNFKIDLEKERLSSFEDNSFNTVICTEVLEHLNNLHDVFDDICSCLLYTSPSPRDRS